MKENKLINNLYQGDSLSLLKRMNELDYKVDLVLTSPPYNNSRSGDSQETRDKHSGNKYDVYIDQRTDKQYIEWIVSYLAEFDKALSKDGLILMNLSYANDSTNLVKDVNPNEAMWRLINEIIVSTDFTIADCIIWKKNNALPNNVSKNKLTRIVEFVFVICRKSELKTFNANKKVKSESRTGQKYYENVQNFIEAPNNDGKVKLNQATFSSDFVDKLLDIYAIDNSIVLDPFMGTGSTAIGVLKSGRGLKYIGFELSGEQVEYSKKRVNEFLKSVDS